MAQKKVENHCYKEYISPTCKDRLGSYTAMGHRGEMPECHCARFFPRNLYENRWLNCVCCLDKQFLQSLYNTDPLSGVPEKPAVCWAFKLDWNKPFKRHFYFSHLWFSILVLTTSNSEWLFIKKHTLLNMSGTKFNRNKWWQPFWAIQVKKQALLQVNTDGRIFTNQTVPTASLKQPCGKKGNLSTKSLRVKVLLFRFCPQLPKAT